MKFVFIRRHTPDLGNFRQTQPDENVHTPVVESAVFRAVIVKRLIFAFGPDGYRSPFEAFTFKVEFRFVSTPERDLVIGGRRTCAVRMSYEFNFVGGWYIHELTDRLV